MVTAVAHDSVTLGWADPGDLSVTGYQVLRRHSSAGSFAVLVDDTGSAAASFTDDTVEAEQTYMYRVRARNQHGLSPRSHFVAVHVPAAPAQPVARDSERIDKDKPAVDPPDRGTRSHQTGQSPWHGHTVVDFGSGGGRQRAQFDNTDAGQQVWFRFTATFDEVVEFRIPGSPFPRDGAQVMNMSIWWQTSEDLMIQNGHDIVNDPALGNFMYFIPEVFGTYLLRVDYPGRYTDPEPAHFKVVLSRPTDHSDYSFPLGSADCPSSYFTHKNCRITSAGNPVNGHFLNSRDHSYDNDSGVKDVDVWTAWLRPGQDYEFCVRTYAAGGFVVMRSFAGTLYAENPKGASVATICGTTGKFEYGTKFYFRVFNTTHVAGLYTVNYE